MEQPSIRHTVARILASTNRYEADTFCDDDVERGTWPADGHAAVVASPVAFQHHRDWLTQPGSRQSQKRHVPVILALGSHDFCRHRDKIAAADSFVVTDESLMRLPSVVALSRHGLAVIPTRMDNDRFVVDPRLSLLKKLSQRDRHVLIELSRGQSNSDIAGSLGTTVSMAKVYVRRLLDIFGFKNRTDAAVFAAALLIADDLEAHTP